MWCFFIVFNCNKRQEISTIVYFASTFALKAVSSTVDCFVVVYCLLLLIVFVVVYCCSMFLLLIAEQRMGSIHRELGWGKPHFYGGWGTRLVWWQSQIGQDLDQSMKYKASKFIFSYWNGYNTWKWRQM